MDYLTATVEMADAIHNILHTSAGTMFESLPTKNILSTSQKEFNYLLASFP